MRAVCLRCRRPASVCWCAHLTPIASRTRVVFLQHPRESRVKVGTCRMAHLALPNSELHLGVSFAGHARVDALATSSGTAVLFPGPGAVEPTALPGGPPGTLVVIDGTWSEARKLLARNPQLDALPRIGIVPERPGAYRIRREPAPHCLSTIEAVVDVLGRLEGDRARFLPMLRAFEYMVETQLAGLATRPRPYTHTRRRSRVVPPAPLVTRRPDLVLVSADANAHPAGAGVPGRSELVHLVALRPHTGERFEAVIAPRRPLAPSTPHHLELPAARMLQGEAVGAALARWEAFLRPEDVLCTWGRHALDLLRAEGAAERPLLDLRDTIHRRLGRRTGGVERYLGDSAPPAPWAAGRAGRQIAALTAVLE